MSRITTALSPPDLLSLLTQSRRNNEEAGITGALAYSKQQFMQVLEGEQQAISKLYERILQDARHLTVLKLADKAITQRTFTTWSMAFRELTPGQFMELAGYVSPAQLGQTDVVTNSVLLDRMRSIVLA